MKIYHHNDADGRCAAAIAYRALKGDINEIQCIEVDYKDTVDVSSIVNGEEIYILDFSFKPEMMKKIMYKTDWIIWIDHHRTAIDYGYRVGGIFNPDFSACELTWEFFHSDIPMPMAVRLIGDYDTWKFNYGLDTEYFHEGLKLLLHGPKDDIWNNFFNPSHNNLDVYDTINRGFDCVKFRDQICAEYIKSFGYATWFDGYASYAVNLRMFGSKQFGDLIEKYPICIGYVFDGKDYTVGLYSEKVDVSEIAKKHGGGGHAGAAGIVCKELPFARGVA